MTEVKVDDAQPAVPRFIFELTCLEEGKSSYRVNLPQGAIRQLELAQHLTAVLAKLMQEPGQEMIPAASPSEGAEE